MCQEIETELSSQLQPNMAMNSKGALTRFARNRVRAGRVYAKMVRSFGICDCAYL